jgi:ectoine hydroxylase-related dioxygenase (phytanoyl-CoA dioxygenase family)
MSAPALPRFDPNAPVDAVSQALEQDGAVIVEDLVQSDALARLGTELSPWFARAPCGEGLFFGRRTRRFSGLFAKSAASWPLAIHPFVLAVVERALRVGEAGHCDAVQLNLTQAIGLEPGQASQAPHRDDALFPFAHDFELMVNAMWALDRFTVDNGATLIAPGSNRWDRTRAPMAAEFAAADAPAGSVILWLGSTLHCGGANRSAQIRRGVTLSYSLGWLAQAEKLLLTTPPDLARRMPERLQRLLGYQVHRPNLGWIEERDPLEWLNGAIGELAPAQDHLTPTQAARVAAFHALHVS